MPYKTADQIAELFFKSDRASTTETDSMTKIEWRAWKYWLTAKQGNWLMNTAQHGTGEYFNGRNGKPMARGSFTRDNVEYGWTATRIGANGNVMFEVITKIADHSQDAARDTAFNAGYFDFEDGKYDGAATYAPFEADYERGQQAANKDSYNSEASLRWAESGGAYEAFCDAWAHNAESPIDAEREEMAIQDFERQLAACPNGIQNN